MRVRLLKRDSTKHGDYPMGTILQLSNWYALKKILEGTAEKYNGEYPPKKKMRTQLFKPKENGNN